MGQAKGVYNKYRTYVLFHISICRKGSEVMQKQAKRIIMLIDCQSFYATVEKVAHYICTKYAETRQNILITFC